jgi:general stress protein 26
MTNGMDTPAPNRPQAPSYGISAGPEGLLSWEWVDAEMAKSRNYWICTVSPKGIPHATPVWGVWLDGVLYFGAARDSRKARHLAANPRVAVHLESGDDVVMFEGTAEEMTDYSQFAPIGSAYVAKYDVPFEANPDEPNGAVCFVLKPRKVFAWREHDFRNTATRWEF